MKKFISIFISVVILFYIYAQIDTANLIKVLQNCHLFWTIGSLGMFIPIVLITSWRLQLLMPEGTGLSFIEANRLTLGASVLNMVLPSKMGDLAKAYFMRDRLKIRGSLSLAISIFEKSCDMLSLLMWCAFGLIYYPNKNVGFGLIAAVIIGSFIFGVMLLSSLQVANLFFNFLSAKLPDRLAQKIHNMHEAWGEMHDYFWRDKQQLSIVILTSIFLWFLHLSQIWLFIIALKAWTPFIISLALSPLALLAGLLPLGFAGIGTRDAALIFFYEPYFDRATSAALGILCTSRYLLPAILGLPFLGQMLATVRSKT
jgi:glycosyltransferase 2 family protein